MVHEVYFDKELDSSSSSIKVACGIIIKNLNSTGNPQEYVVDLKLNRLAWESYQNEDKEQDKAALYHLINTGLDELIRYFNTNEEPSDNIIEIVQINATLQFSKKEFVNFINKKISFTWDGTRWSTKNNEKFGVEFNSSL